MKCRFDILLLLFILKRSLLHKQTKTNSVVSLVFFLQWKSYTLMLEFEKYNLLLKFSRFGYSSLKYRTLVGSKVENGIPRKKMYVSSWNFHFSILSLKPKRMQSWFSLHYVIWQNINKWCHSVLIDIVENRSHFE